MPNRGNRSLRQRYDANSINRHQSAEKRIRARETRIRQSDKLGVGELSEQLLHPNRSRYTHYDADGRVMYDYAIEIRNGKKHYTYYDKNGKRIPAKQALDKQGNYKNLNEL